MKTRKEDMKLDAVKSGIILSSIIVYRVTDDDSDEVTYECVTINLCEDIPRISKHIEYSDMGAIKQALDFWHWWNDIGVEFIETAGGAVIKRTDGDFFDALNEYNKRTVEKQVA